MRRPASPPRSRSTSRCASAGSRTSRPPVWIQRELEKIGFKVNITRQTDATFRQLATKGDHAALDRVLAVVGERPVLPHGAAVPLHVEGHQHGVLQQPGAWTRSSTRTTTSPTPRSAWPPPRLHRRSSSMTRSGACCGTTTGRASCAPTWRHREALGHLRTLHGDEARLSPGGLSRLLPAPALARHPDPPGRDHHHVHAHLRPARQSRGRESGAAGLAQVGKELEKEMGLDQPAWVQYWRYISGVVRGDLGQSASTAGRCWRISSSACPPRSSSPWPAS